MSIAPTSQTVKAHSKNEITIKRTKIALLSIISITVIAVGIIAIYGASKLEMRGWQPINFIGTTITDAPIPFIASASCMCIFAAFYIGRKNSLPSQVPRLTPSPSLQASTQFQTIVRNTNDTINPQQAPAIASTNPSNTIPTGNAIAQSSVAPHLASNSSSSSLAKSSFSTQTDISSTSTAITQMSSETISTLRLSSQDIEEIISSLCEDCEINGTMKSGICHYGFDFLQKPRNPAKAAKLQFVVSSSPLRCNLIFTPDSRRAITIPLRQVLEAIPWNAISLRETNCQIVRCYTSTMHKQINKFLKQDFSAYRFHLKENFYHALQIADYLNKHYEPSPFPVLWKGVNQEESSLNIQEPGTIIRHGILCSTSGNQETATAFALSGEGIPILYKYVRFHSGCYIGKISFSPEEDEVLFLPSTQLRVISKTPTTISHAGKSKQGYLIEVEEV